MLETILSHLKRTEKSGKIYWGGEGKKQWKLEKQWNFNDNHLNERKSKKKKKPLLLEKILDVEREITQNYNQNNINIFCMWKIKGSTFTVCDVKLNFRNKKSPDLSSISVR